MSKKSLNQKTLVAVTNGQTAKAKAVKIKAGKVGKGKVVKMPVVAPTASVVAPVAPVAPIVTPSIHIGDAVTFAPSAKTWNSPIDAPPWDRKTQNLATWDVETQPLTLPGNVPSGLSMLVCTDTGLPLGKVNKKGELMGRLSFNPLSYHVLNNERFMDIIYKSIDALAAIGVKAEPMTSGSHTNRSCVFVSLRIDKHDTYKIGERVFKDYIDFINSFNKTYQFIVTNSSVCVCCANTCRMAAFDETGAFKMSVSHDKNMEFPLSEIPKMVEVAFKCQDKFHAKLKFWNEFPVSLGECESIFAAYLGKAENDAQADAMELSTRALNTIDTLKALYAKGKGNKGETALDVFSAVTDYYTHESAGGDDANKQGESSEFGAGQRSKQSFFELLSAITSDGNKAQKWIGAARIGEKILLATAKAIKARAK